MSGFMDEIKKAAGGLLGGDNQGILDALKKMTPDDVQAAAPGDPEASGTFAKIIQVVENAVKNNQSKNDLMTNLMTLGTKAVDMMKNIPVLSKLMG
ncbi:MAG: hypothetical protein ACRCSQ_06400 [Bacteroidales bacterium]